MPSSVFFDNLHEALKVKRELQQPTTSAAEASAFSLKDEDIAIAFARQYVSDGGVMYYACTEEELKQHLAEICRQLHHTAIACCSDTLAAFLQSLGFKGCFPCVAGEGYPVGAIVCDALEAWNGAVVVTDMLGIGTRLQQMPAATITIAFTSQLTRDWPEVLEHLKASYATQPKEILCFTPHSIKHPYLILVEDT